MGRSGGYGDRRQRGNKKIYPARLFQESTCRYTSNVFWQIKIENAVKSVKAKDFDAYVAVGRFHKR